MTAPGLRYLAVVVLGLGVDLAIAMALVSTGAPRTVASASGLLCGALFNFVLHRAWTFRDSPPKPLRQQLAGYAASLAFVLLLRLALLSGLRFLPLPLSDRMAIVLVTGVSFVVNYVLLRTVVFKKGVGA